MSRTHPWQSVQVQLRLGGAAKGSAFGSIIFSTSLLPRHIAHGPWGQFGIPYVGEGEDDMEMLGKRQIVQEGKMRSDEATKIPVPLL